MPNSAPPPAPPVHGPNQPISGASFTFSLDSMKITNTRSRHEDTDYVSFTMVVTSNKNIKSTKNLKKSMGDLNNGTFGIALSFPDVHVQDGDHVALNYLVINSGHQHSDEVYSTLSKAGSNLATAGLAAAGALVGSAIPIPGLGTALGALGGYLVGQVTSLITADCDGLVAAEGNVFKYLDLLERTTHGKFTHETRHPGTDSAHGCGSNSNYYVTWSIQKV